MSCNASQVNLEEISSTESCALDKMPLTSKEKETDRKEESPGETTPTKTSNLAVIRSNMLNILQNSEPSERVMLTNLGLSMLKGYNIEEDVTKAAESGNVEEYCKDLVKKLEECVKTEVAEFVEECKHGTDQTVELIREDRKRKKQGKAGEKSFKAMLKSLPKGMKAIIEESRSFADIEAVCYTIKSAMDEELQAFQTNTSKEAQRIAEKVSDAAKHMCSAKHEESESALSTCSTTDESVTSLEKDNGKDLVDSELDENSEKPSIAEQEEEPVIPTPPPPPPVKSPYRDIKDEMDDHLLKCRKRQVNLAKKELNFALSRLTSEVISSYEQATALQEQVPPSLDKPTLDFMQNQETKKTFFIREIITRVSKVLSMLTPEPEIHDPNVDLQDLNETVRLLYLLQTSKQYHVDGVSVSRTTNENLGVLFHTLLTITLLLIALALSLNGEWLALIVFAIVVLIFLVKAWEASFSVRRKKVEVFGRVKKSEKLD